MESHIPSSFYEVCQLIDDVSTTPNRLGISGTILYEGKEHFSVIYHARGDSSQVRRTLGIGIFNWEEQWSITILEVRTGKKW